MAKLTQCKNRGFVYFVRYFKSVICKDTTDGKGGGQRILAQSEAPEGSMEGAEMGRGVREGETRKDKK